MPGTRSYIRRNARGPRNTQAPTNPASMSVNEVSVQAPEGRKYPASVHFAFVAGVLLPLAVIPYALSRRQTSLVRNRLQETERVISGLQKELRTTKRELEAFRDQHTRSSSQIKAVQGSVDELTQRSHRLQVEGVEGQKALLQYAVELERDIQSTQ